MRRSPESDPQAGSAALAPYSAPTYNVPSGAYAPPVNSLPLSLPSPNRNVPTFMGLLNALKRRWVLASFLGLLVAAAAAVALWIAAPQGKHQVKALIEVTNESAALLPGFTQQNDDARNNQEGLMVLIKTRTLLTRVAQNPTLANTQIASGDDPAKAIEDMLRLRWEAPNLMAVVMNGDKPDELKKVLDVLITAFKEETGSKLNQKRQKDKDILIQARNKYLKDIDDAEKIARQNIALGVPVTLPALNEDIKTAGDDFRKAKAARGEAEVRLASLEKQAESAAAQLAALQTRKFTAEEIEAVLLKEKDSSLLGLQADLEAAQKKLTLMKPVYKDERHPKIVEVENEIKSINEKRASVAVQREVEVSKKLRAEKRDEIEKKLVAIRDEQTIKASNKQDFAKAEADANSRLAVLNANTPAVTKLAEVLKPKYAEVERLGQQITQMELSLNSGGRIEIRENAIVMYNHNQKQKMLYSAMVGVAAFLVVLTLVAFLEWRSRRVDSVDQVINEIGMRVIGTIPAFPSRQSIKTGEADANQNWRFILNESVNSTRTMLLHTAKTQSMQVIMVTSAMQGEGKTSLSSQLATSMATAGLRTLIVDCDLRNPSMHRLFDLPLAPGCSEILLSELDVSDAVQPTTVPNLWVISAGQCSNRVIAALAQGHQLESLFNRLRGQFDFIVVDSCPVLPVADTLLIGQHVDGVLISILQDISQLPKVLDASDRLAQLNIPMLGAVVNGIKTDIHAYGYNYVKQLPA